MLDDFKRIRVLSADHLNLARGKYVPAGLAKKGEMNACIGIYAVDYKRDLINAPGAGMEMGLPDLKAIYDIKQVRPSWGKGYRCRRGRSIQQ